MTNFFKQLGELGATDLTMKIKIKDNIATVMVMSNEKSAKDILPFSCTGTLEEVDANFMTTMVKPMSEVVAFTSNAAQVSESVAKAGEEPSKSAEKKPKEKALTNAQLAKIEKATEKLKKFVEPFTVDIQWKNNRKEVEKLIEPITAIQPTNEYALEITAKIKSLFEEVETETKAEEQNEIVAPTENIAEIAPAEPAPVENAISQDITIGDIAQEEIAVNSETVQASVPAAPPVLNRPFYYEEREHQLFSLGLSKNDNGVFEGHGFNISPKIIEEHSAEYWQSLIDGIKNELSKSEPEQEKPQVVEPVQTAAAPVEAPKAEEVKTETATSGMVAMPQQEGKTPFQLMVEQRQQELASYNMVQNGSAYENYGLSVHIIDVKTANKEKWASIIQSIEEAIFTANNTVQTPEAPPAPVSPVTNLLAD